MECADSNVLVAFAAGDMTPRRRRAVAEHIDQCPICADAVAGAAAELDREADSQQVTSPQPQGASPQWQRGDAAGRFVILDRVGAGGLGTVYAAYDPDLDRRVAIKVLHGGVDLHLVREARALAQVSHPNVVPVHELGIIEGHAFIAMELVDGQTLRDWLAAQPRTWMEIRDVFVDAARGLAAVHAAGLVHRDVKPTNIVVGRDGRARVLDLGLAHLAPRRAVEAVEAVEVGEPARAPAEPVSTETGTLVGTPAYMAPEQFRGAGVDARADQFGLGVALYEALHGQRPFTPEAVQCAATGSPLPAPSAETAAKGPRWLRQVALRGLASDPADRHRSMEAFAEALVADRRSRRRQWLVALALVLGTASTVTAVALALDQPTDHERSAVEALTQEALRAGARNYFVYPPTETPQLRTAFVVVEELAALDHDAAARLREEFAETLVRLGDRYWDEAGGRGFASDYYAQALLFDPDHRRAAERAFVSTGQLAALSETARRGGFTPAELGAAESLAALAEPDPAARRRKVQQLSHVGEVTRSNLHRLVGDPTPPRPTEPPPPAGDEPDAAEPDASPRPTPSPSSAAPPSTSSRARDPQQARALTRRGRAAMRARQLDKAATLFRQALAADTRHTDALIGLAEAHFEQGELGAAVRTAEQARAVAPRRAEVHLLLGDLYRKVRRYDAARSAYQTARTLGHRHAAAKLDALERSIK